MWMGFSANVFSKLRQNLKPPNARKHVFLYSKEFAAVGNDGYAKNSEICNAKRCNVIVGCNIDWPRTMSMSMIHGGSAHTALPSCPCADNYPHPAALGRHLTLTHRASDSGTERRITSLNWTRHEIMKTTIRTNFLHRFEFAKQINNLRRCVRSRLWKTNHGRRKGKRIHKNECSFDGIASIRLNTSTEFSL